MISVVIPCYNAETTIAAAIRSVIDQNGSFDREILVVDDGSTDSSREVVTTLAKTVQNNSCSIRLICKENGGVSSARNCGIAESIGEWVAFCDSDDIWLPDRLASQFAQISENRSILCIGGNRNDELYRLFGKHRCELFSLNHRELLWKWHVHISTILIHRTVLDQIGGFNESMRRCEDAEFLVKIARFMPIMVVNRTIALTGGGKESYGDSGLSADLRGMRAGERQVVRFMKEMKMISPGEHLFFSIYQELKYWRRIVIVFCNRLIRQG